MYELALFAGAGGGLLASEILGWRTVCAVELDEHCRRILVRRQNERYLRSGFPIWDDIRSFDGRTWRGRVNIVSGGFPCQAFSSAASGRNIPEKDLWHEMRRVVGEVQPTYVWAENVSKRAIDRAADDLEAMGYQAECLTLGASDLGGDHIRARHWLLAYTDDKSKLLRRFNAEVAIGQSFQNGVWSTDPRSSGVADGLANRVDRYRATGNGQVPVVAAAALAIICNS